MDEQEYLVPENVSVEASLFDGLISIKRLIEAAVLSSPICFALYIVPASINNKIIFAIVTLIPIIALSMAGINNDSITEFVIYFIAYRKSKRLLKYNPNIKIIKSESESSVNVELPRDKVMKLIKKENASNDNGQENENEDEYTKYDNEDEDVYFSDDPTLDAIKKMVEIENTAIKNINKTVIEENPIGPSKEEIKKQKEMELKNKRTEQESQKEKAIKLQKEKEENDRLEKERLDKLAREKLANKIRSETNFNGSDEELMAYIETLVSSETKTTDKKVKRKRKNKKSNPNNIDFSAETVYSSEKNEEIKSIQEDEMIERVNKEAIDLNDEDFNDDEVFDGQNGELDYYDGDDENYDCDEEPAQLDKKIDRNKEKSVLLDDEVDYDSNDRIKTKTDVVFEIIEDDDFYDNYDDKYNDYDDSDDDDDDDDGGYDQLLDEDIIWSNRR